MTYHIYPQDPGTPSARSDTDLWNHINRWVWGKSGAESSPRGTWGAGESTAIVPTLERYGQEHQDFHFKLQSLGDVAQSAKEHRDSIESKLGSHSHNGLGGLLGGLGAGLGTTAVIAVVVIGGYFYLTSRGRKKILKKVRRKK